MDRQRLLLAAVVVSFGVFLGDLIAVNVAGEVSSGWWVLAVPVGLIAVPIVGLVCLGMLIRDRRAP